MRPVGWVLVQRAEQIQAVEIRADERTPIRREIVDTSGLSCGARDDRRRDAGQQRNYYQYALQSDVSSAVPGGPSGADRIAALVAI
jgi:hypothetical protein